MSSLLTAISFLTRAPVRKHSSVNAAEVAHSAGWFPLVGAALGSLYTAVAALLKGHLPPLAIGALLMLVDALATGALHLDGLADTADGFGGGREPKEVLRIMHDHRIGSYGGVALALCVVTKVAAYAALLGRSNWIAGLILTPALGRWCALLLTATLPYAGAGASVAEDMGGRVPVLGTVVIAVSLACARSLRALVAAVVVMIVTAGFGLYCRTRIAGITGDTLGANVELCECAALIAFLWTR